MAKEIKTYVEQLDKAVGKLDTGSTCFYSHPPSSLHKKLLKYMIYKNLQNGIPCGFISAFQSFKDFKKEFESYGWKIEPSTWKNLFVYGDLFTSSFHEIMVMKENIVVGYFKKVTHVTEVSNRVINSISKKGNGPSFCVIDILSRLSQLKHEDIESILHENSELANRSQTVIVYTLENGIFNNKIDTSVFSWMENVIEVKKPKDIETLEIRKSSNAHGKLRFLIKDEGDSVKLEIDRSAEGKSREEIMKFLD